MSNGFTYVDLFRSRGMDINQFGPRLSFFLDCGLDVEYLVLGRVCRRIWAIRNARCLCGGTKSPDSKTLLLAQNEIHYRQYPGTNTVWPLRTSEWAGT